MLPLLSALGVANLETKPWKSSVILAASFSGSSLAISALVFSHSPFMTCAGAMPIAEPTRS